MTFSVLKTENKLLLLLLGIKLALVSCLILFSPLDLSPDEAQYWTWSQHLDWGYYSKPPAIAWQIWLTTFLFGDNAFGVRAGALIIGTLIPLCIYRLARTAALSEEQSFWAAVAFAFSPLGIYLSFAATTDGGAILFLTGAMVLIAKACIEGKAPNYYKIGCLIFFGVLYKWTVFLIWPFALFFKPRWSLVGGLLISLAALLPSTYWNHIHDWATFKHVGTSLTQSTHGNCLAFLGSQVALLSPIFFVLWVLSYRDLLREKNRALLFCGVIPLTFCLFLGASLFKKVQPNWMAYLYPPAFVLLAWYAFPRWKQWIKAGTLLTSVLFLFPFVPIPYEYNPLRQLVGWRNLQPILNDVGFRCGTDFLFGDKYQTASLLSFYSANHKAYFFNISGSRQNQFSYWPQMSECERGKTGYFFVLEHTDDCDWYTHHYCDQLSPYFAHVDFVGMFPLAKNGKAALIFRCDNYLGKSCISNKKW